MSDKMSSSYRQNNAAKIRDKNKNYKRRKKKKNNVQDVHSDKNKNKNRDTYKSDKSWRRNYYKMCDEFDDLSEKARKCHTDFITFLISEK